MAYGQGEQCWSAQSSLNIQKTRVVVISRVDVPLVLLSLVSRVSHLTHDH